MLLKYVQLPCATIYIYIYIYIRVCVWVRTQLRLCARGCVYFGVCACVRCCTNLPSGKNELYIAKHDDCKHVASSSKYHGNL